MWSVAAALPTSLLFEQPMLTLEKFLLPNRRSDHTTKVGSVDKGPALPTAFKPNAVNQNETVS